MQLLNVNLKSNSMHSIPKFMKPFIFLETTFKLIFRQGNYVFLWISTPSSNTDPGEFRVEEHCSCDFIKLNIVHGNQPWKFPSGHCSDHGENTTQITEIPPSRTATHSTAFQNFFPQGSPAISHTSTVLQFQNCIRFKGLCYSSDVYHYLFLFFQFKQAQHPLAEFYILFLFFVFFCITITIYHGLICNGHIHKNVNKI